MKNQLLSAAIVAAILAAIPAWHSIGAEAPAKDTAIKDIMKAQFKGDTSNYKKALKGELDKAGLEKLLADCKTICAKKPAKGDDASWKEKAGALCAAVDSLVKGEPDAAAKVEKAGNCKACHDVHKGKGPGGPPPAAPKPGQ